VPWGRLYTRYGVIALTSTFAFLVLVKAYLLALLLGGFILYKLRQRLRNSVGIPQRAMGLGLWQWLSTIVVGLGVFFLVLHFVGVTDAITTWLQDFTWDEFGSWAEWSGSIVAVPGTLIALASLLYVYQQIALNQTQIVQSTKEQLREFLIIDERISLIEQGRNDALAMVQAVMLNKIFGKHGIAALLISLSTSGYLTRVIEDRYIQVAYDPKTGRPMEDWINGIRPIPIERLRSRGMGFFDGMDMSETTLTAAVLAQLSFKRSDFSYCDLTSCRLFGTNFTGANFSGAILVECQYYLGTNPETASPAAKGGAPDVVSGELSGAIFTDAVFWEATLDLGLYQYLKRFGSKLTLDSLRTARIIQD
jgi:hypothetical protein